MKTKTIIAANCLLAVMTIICLVASPFFQFRFPSRIPDRLSTYNFCTINTNALRYFSPRLDGLKHIDSLAKSNRIDVLCLQELDCYDELSDSVIVAELNSVFPYVYRRGEVVLASRFPIVNTKHHRFDRTLGLYAYCDLDLGEDTVRVFNLHLQTTGINNARNQFTDTLSMKEKIVIVNRRMKMYEEIRWRQAETISKDVSVSPYPVVIMGDLNSHPFSRIYKLLTDGLLDSFLEKGSGFGSTYRGLKGIVRTDYILHDESICCRGYKRIKDNISDHYAIVSSLDFGLDE